MPLCRLYTFRETVKWVHGVKVVDPHGRKIVAHSVGLAGASIRARGRRPLDKDYGVFDLTPEQYEAAVKSELFAVVPA